MEECKQRYVGYVRFWIPKLRNAVKSAAYNCILCKRNFKGSLKPPAKGTCQSFAVNWVNRFKQLESNH